eukprot:365122-Chlamydomonas_euryale.AAC.58
MLHTRASVWRSVHAFAAQGADAAAQTTNITITGASSISLQDAVIGRCAGWQIACRLDPTGRIARITLIPASKRGLPVGLPRKTAIGCLEEAPAPGVWTQGQRQPGSRQAD